MQKYRLTFYAPEEQLDSVKEAIFATGAGRFNHYDCCCWQSLGQGQFRALAGSDPFIGQQQKVTSLPEYKVEILCTEDNVEAAVAALKKAHPYEEPAYEVYRLEAF